MHMTVNPMDFPLIVIGSASLSTSAPARATCAHRGESKRTSVMLTSLVFGFQFATRLTPVPCSFAGKRYPTVDGNEKNPLPSTVIGNHWLLTSADSTGGAGASAGAGADAGVFATGSAVIVRNCASRSAYQALRHATSW